MYPFNSKDCSFYRNRLICSKFGSYGDKFGIAEVSVGINFETIANGSTTAWNCPHCGCRD